jgi:hypothetical protein
MRNRTVFILSLLVLLMVNARAQEPTPTPAKTQSSAGTPSNAPASDEGATYGNFNVISSVELGVRGASVDGDHDLYRSQLNYQPGFRIFDSSFLARAKDGTSGTLFDTLLVNSTGWGSDPAGSLRINVEKPKWYRFDGNFRRNSYDSRLVNFANPFSNTNVLGQHTWQTKHKFGDFDLKLLPLNRRIRFNLGYSFDRNSGPNTTTYDYSSDEYPVLYNFRTRANEYRFGVEGRVGGVDLNFLQGLRYYRDDPLFISGLNRGNNATDITFLSSFQRSQPARGRVSYSRFSAHTLIAQQFDITARYTYTKARSEFTFFESDAGRQGSRTGGNFIIGDFYVSPGTTERPSHLFDLGMTWLATKKLRISDTIRYYKFDIEGAQQYTEMLFLRRASNGTVNAVPTTPVLPFPTVTNLVPSRTTNYRRFLNQIEADYQWSPRFSFHAGYRYTHRDVNIEGLVNLANLTAPQVISDEFKNSTNTVFGGFKARPWNFWNIYLDFSKGTTDNVFVRVDAYNTTYFRVRNRFTPRKDLAITLSLVTRDNNNPGDFDPVLAPELQGLGAQINSRALSSTVDWSPNSKFSLSTGYTFTDVTSDVDIIYFVAGSSRRVGRSQYFMRDNYFFVNASLQPHPRFTAYVGYRINRDPGQGSRPSTPDPNTFVRSLPYRLQSPEFRLVFKLNNRLDLNAGYQYYSYRDEIKAPEDLRFPQAYRAHLPYISLRFYFGRRE